MKKRTLERKSTDATLRRLAARIGIQECFVGMGGKTHHASRAAIRGLLELWGIPVGNRKDAQRALAEVDLQEWRRPVESVNVAAPGAAASVWIRLPDPVDTLKCLLTLEDGTTHDLSRAVARAGCRRRKQIGGQEFLALQVDLPKMPAGYHELVLTQRHRDRRSLIVCAPEQSYAPPERLRAWSAFLPLYGAHSKSSWGAGNLSDWRRLGEFVHSAGGKVLSTLPLTAQFLGKPVCEPSPYSPASRLFWNEFYLDVEGLPQFAYCKPAQKRVRSARFQQMLDGFRRCPLIDYEAQAAARREVLRLISEWFSANVCLQHRDFQRFLQQRPEVREYARFRATCERNGTGWPAWDVRQQRGKLQPEDYDQRDADYHLYVQWQMERQMDALSGSFRRQNLELYLDLPVGVHPDSYDVWRQRDTFALQASVGAPPDPLFTQGQNWGFAPLHPQRLREQGHRYFIDFIRFQMRHVGLLRIDHVMGLHRLFWIPSGLGAIDGAYVRYPAEELHAILRLESHRNRTLLVGENLGIVPPEVTRAMQDRGVREIFVMQFEQQPDPAQAVRTPPSRSVASLNTHDMPMFAAHWSGKDIDQRAALGWVKGKQGKTEKAARAILNRSLATFLRRKGFLSGRTNDRAALLRACLEWLAAGPAEIVQVNLEDLWGEVEPQNIPGTSRERPNWRRKAALTIEDMESSAEIRHVLGVLAQLRDSRRSVIARGPPKSPSR